MARNKVQFQKGLSMVEFLKKHGTEEACRDAVFKLHWPSGFLCPECGNSTYCVLKSRAIFQCHHCHHQASLTARTIFEKTKLKRLGRYLGTFAYSFNRRYELGSMIERLAYVACRTAPLPYRFATMAEVHT